MKNNDWLIIIATATYSFLFFNQDFGLNLFIFNIVLILLLFISHRQQLLRLSWLAACVGSIISSFFVFWWGTALPVTANICSLLALVGFSFHPESSLLVSAFNTLYSSFAAIPHAFTISLFPKEAEPVGSNGNVFKRLFLVLVPITITGIFYYVYKFANPVFAKYADKINLDFISFDWIVFTTIGLILMFGVFRYSALKWLVDTDNNAPDNLPVITLEDHLRWQSSTTLSVPNEVLTGVILFSLLNLLLLCVNSIDAWCMWIAQKLPEGVTLADYLHDGTDTLIVSILMAIAVILYVFRGYLNFISENKLLKALCYGWIAQNAVLIITTANRNWWIIQSTGLTRRRIGVYVYLALCLVGLATTLLKVAGLKSNWFLFRKNGWAFYAIFIFSCIINWDDLIVRYNCKNFQALQFNYIDRNYQVELSHTCLASLFEFYYIEKQDTQPGNKIFKPEIINSMYATYGKLKKETEQASWKSYCVSKQQNVKQVEEMISKNEPVK